MHIVPEQLTTGKREASVGLDFPPTWPIAVRFPNVGGLMRIVVFVLVGVVAGCQVGTALPNGDPFGDGGSPLSTPTPDGGTRISQSALYESGTRIRARVGTSPDGAKTFLGWFDTTLNAQCFVQLASDGKYRCLPTANSAATGYFADSACQMNLGSRQNCGLTGYATSQTTTFGANGPTTALSVYPIEGAYDTASGFYVQQADGGCAPATNYGSPSAYVKLGAEIPPTEFAEFNESLQ